MMLSRGVCPYLPMARLTRGHFFEGDIFQLKIYFLKLYDLQPFYSDVFLRMFRQFSLSCVFDVWYVTCFTVTDT